MKGGGGCRIKYNLSCVLRARGTRKELKKQPPPTPTHTHTDDTDKMVNLSRVPCVRMRGTRENS